MMVDENRIDGAVRNMGGKLQDAVGGLTGDTETQARGKANQVTGTAQNAFGSAADVATEWSSAIADTAKHKPLTALLVAISVGYVLRMLTHSAKAYGKPSAK